MPLIRILVQTAGAWWILVGVPVLGVLANSLPSQHPLVVAAAIVWVVGVVPACVLSASSGKSLVAGFRAAWRALRTWVCIVGSIALAGALLSLAIH